MSLLKVEFDLYINFDYIFFQGFYKEVMSFNDEERRVNALFACVAEKNIKVDKRWGSNVQYTSPESNACYVPLIVIAGELDAKWFVGPFTDAHILASIYMRRYWQGWKLCNIFLMEHDQNFPPVSQHFVMFFFVLLPPSGNISLEHGSQVPYFFQAWILKRLFCFSTIGRTFA